MPKTKKSGPYGCCTFKISLCRLHRKYLCTNCHPVSKQSKWVLISVPEYLPDTEKDCTWTGLKGSIQKHAKKFHGIKSGFRKYWKESKEIQSNNPFTRSQSQSQSQNPNVIEIEPLFDSDESDASNPEDPVAIDEDLVVLSQDTVIIEEEKVVVELEPPALEPEGMA